MTRNLVVLAGGVSSRMKQAAEGVSRDVLSEASTKEKAMISVGERPFLDFVLGNAQQAGIRNVVLLVSERDSSIRSYYASAKGSAQFPELTLSFATQPIPPGRTKPFGTADALLHALRSVPQWRGESFIVCNSDNLYSVHAIQLLTNDTHAHALIGYDRAALNFDEQRIAAFAVLSTDADGFLREIVEKPSPEESRRLADANGRITVSMNIFKFSYDLILPQLESVPIHPIRQEKELPEAVRSLVRATPQSVFVIPLAEHVPDLTSPGDIERVRRELGATQQKVIA